MLYIGIPKGGNLVDKSVSKAERDFAHTVTYDKVICESSSLVSGVLLNNNEQIGNASKQGLLPSHSWPTSRASCVFAERSKEKPKHQTV